MKKNIKIGICGAPLGKALVLVGPVRGEQLINASKNYKDESIANPGPGVPVIVTLTKEAMDRSMAIHKDVLKKLIENK
jgi:hypothetical protein